MPDPSLAVVGGSVRGTALLARLAARLRAAPPAGPLTVHVIDPHPPGSGRVWRDGQPQRLVMNTVAGQSTVFDDPSLGFAAPGGGPSLAEWCARIGEPGWAEPLPAPVAAEAARTGPASTPSRLLYGHYLRWAHAEAASRVPAGVRVRHHRDTVVDAEAAGRGGLLRLASGRTLRVDAAVLATGWSPSGAEARAGELADIGPESPIDQGLDRIRPGERVAVLGLGMGFFDLLSILTEGRGGRYEGLGPETVYRPGGREPRLFVGSRSGLPFLAKPDFGAVPPPPAHRRLRAALPGLLARRPLDFAADVLPLILADAADADPGFDPASPSRPLPEGARDAAAIHAALRDRIAADAAEAARGGDSPRKLALHSLQAARATVLPLVTFGGLTPASAAGDYADFLELAGRVGSGPPLFRVWQLLAAIDAGVVTLVGPELTVSAGPAGRTVHSGRAPDGPRQPIDRVVAAHLPLPRPGVDPDPLWSALFDRGLARAWRDAAGREHPAAEVRERDGALVSATGAASDWLFSVGLPHERLRGHTIIAPVPGSGSSVLRELDAAAAAALASLRATAPGAAAGAASEGAQPA